MSIDDDEVADGDDDDEALHQETLKDLHYFFSLDFVCLVTIFTSITCAFRFSVVSTAAAATITFVVASIQLILLFLLIF